MFTKIRTVFFGNAVNAALVFVTTIILSRMLGVADFGKYGYLSAMAVIAVGVLDFASGTSFVVNYARQGMAPRILANYNAFRLGSLGVTAGAGLVFFLLPSAIYSPADKVFVITLVASSLVSMHFQSYYQGAGDYRSYGTMTVLNSAVKLLSIAGLSLFLARSGEARLDAAMLVLACAQAFAVISAMALARRDVAWGTSFRFDREFLRSLLYLGIGNILIIVTMRIDAFIIRHVLDFESVGYYHVVFTLCSIFPLLTGSVMTVMVRELSVPEGTREGQRALLRRQVRLLPPGVIAALILVLLSRPLIELIFGGRYEASIPLLQVMIVPFSLGVIFTPLEAHFYAHRPKVVTIMKFAQMVAAILCSLLFIGWYGLVGIGYSTLLVRLIGWSYLVLVVLSAAGGEREQGAANGITASGEKAARPS